MLKWLTSNPLAGGLIVLAVVTFIIAGFAYLGHENQREENNLRNEGAAGEKAAEQEEIFNAVQNANRPVTPAERNSVCSKYDRNCPTSP